MTADRMVEFHEPDRVPPTGQVFAVCAKCGLSIRRTILYGRWEWVSGPSATPYRTCPQ